MKIKLTATILSLIGVALFSFFTSPTASPKEIVKEYFNTRFDILNQKIVALKTSIEENKNEKIIHENFLQARLAYKQVEIFLEYYFELDVAKFNGLAINFVEEEDPTAYQDPQGFQMIESFLYPHIDKDKKRKLLDYVSNLLTVSKGLSNNRALFIPDDYILDAAVEEMYRVLSLGISGFDSPIAQLSLLEAKSSLKSIRVVVEAFKYEIKLAKVIGYEKNVQLLDAAIEYIDSHNNFNDFNRMEFISLYLNPFTKWLAETKIKLGHNDNPSRLSLIKKAGHLFNAGSLETNRYVNDDTVTAAKIALGKKLFYETSLSANGKRSCAGCHQPERGFTDGLPKALQIDEHSLLPRNSPTLWNAAIQKNLFYDSRQNSIDRLILEVMGNEKEMNNGSVNAANKLHGNNEYNTLFHQAYSSADTTITDKKIANAIGMYLRTLISYNSNFDQYMRGDKNKMTPDEIKGFNLFMGKAKCATCHYTPLFNGSKPPTYYYQESEVLGVPATTDTVHPALDADPGRGQILKVDFMNHAFKTPTLRNIALTAPYMHNGVYKTLEEVIDFYDKGGGKGLGINIPNQTLPEEKLKLSKVEKKQIIGFLKTLTDTSGYRP